ncbi:MAG: beta-ketoacyl-ACP synthase II [Armatimonadetes bacterium]|nr:beta-ketoacyl-ACP synthase II [Armatimonadota bacterium]
MAHRVVITGIGAVTPVGIGKDRFWAALARGESGVGPITRFDTSQFSTRIAAEVNDFDPLEYIGKKEAKRLDRFAQYALAASIMAVSDSALKISSENSQEIGVLVGSGIGGIQTLETQHQVLIEKGPDKVSPFFIPMLISNIASGQVSITLGIKGPNTCAVTACATGSHAIGDAFRILQRGEARAMIAGGAEAPITPLGLAGFCSLNALSRRNHEPTRASRPFDKDRDGFVMAEGAGVVVMETRESAETRGAHIYAEVIGYGMNGDAYHITAPDPEGDGAARAMLLAVQDARISPGDVDYINAHGTSTPLNDKVETLAIKRVFGDHARKISISSTKSMTGHVLGATGALEVIATILGMQHGIIPPTINLDASDPECDLDYVPNQARNRQIKIALSNSFGFGGHNAVIAVKRYDN